MTKTVPHPGVKRTGERRYGALHWSGLIIGGFVSAICLSALSALYLPFDNLTRAIVSGLLFPLIWTAWMMRAMLAQRAAHIWFAAALIALPAGALITARLL